MRRETKLLMPLLLLFLLLFAQNVFADDIPEGNYRFRNYNSNLYMDCDGSGCGANIRQMNYVPGASSQKFNIIKDASNKDYYNINLNGELLRVVDVNGASKENSANVQLWDNNGTDAQKWKFISNNDSEGTYRVASKCSDDTKVCGALKTPGINVFQYAYTSNPDGKWYLEADVDDGLYLIRNKKTGLYLTVSDKYVKQSEYTTKNYTNQLFQIKVDNEGYYDIAPVSDTNNSISVRGWDTGNDKEGAYISCEPGQSSEGQCWRFILNGDGSYRIVSQISNCQKGITVLDNSSSNAYSYTYTKEINSNWELVKWYNTESEHIVAEFDIQIDLMNFISPERFNEWMQNMDKAYEAYAELVGGVPQYPLNWNKIHIIKVKKEEESQYEKMQEEKITDAAAWAFCNYKYIYVKNDSLISALRKIEEYGDWNFMFLHEMGHAFDISKNWVFHDELSANLKMAYLFKKYDGEIKVLVNCTWGEELATIYEEIEACYLHAFNDSFIYTFAQNPLRFHNDGLTYILLDLIDGDWEHMKGVYDRIKNMDLNVSNSAKYENFLKIMDTELAKKNVLSVYEDKYVKYHKFICESLDKKEVE